MGELDKYSPRSIAVVHFMIVFFHKTVLFHVCLLLYLIWILSPNMYVALSVMWVSALFSILGVTCIVEFAALVAVKYREIFKSDVLCELFKTLFAWIITAVRKLLHGHEIHGYENLPRTGGALLVYYHPLVPFDNIYLACDLLRRGERPLGGIMDRLLVKAVPNIAELANFYGKREQLVADLKQGRLCSVAPGGALEGAFSENYELLWNGRIGFAEVAKECGVPILPMFTVNSQDAVPVTTFGCKDFLRAVYEKTKRTVFLPAVILPVKLRTFIGEPMHCRADESPAEFAERVKAAIYELRDKYQRRPSSVMLALLERVGYPPFNATAYPPVSK